MAKVGRIVKALVSAQLDASAKEAIQSGNITSAIQAVLDRNGIDTSAHNFAQSNGINVDGTVGSPDQDLLRSQVTKMLDQPSSSTGPTSEVSNLYGKAEHSPLRTLRIRPAPLRLSINQASFTRARRTSPQMGPSPPRRATIPTLRSTTEQKHPLRPFRLLLRLNPIRALTPRVGHAQSQECLGEAR